MAHKFFDTNGLSIERQLFKHLSRIIGQLPNSTGISQLSIIYKRGVGLGMSFSLNSLLVLAAFTFLGSSPGKTDEPFKIKTSNNAFILQNVYRGLTRYGDDGQLIFDQAKKCFFKNPLTAICKIREEAKWWDGKPILAHEFVDGFKKRKGNLNLSSVAEVQITPDSNDSEIEFKLKEEDKEFFEKLADPELVPTRIEKNLTQVYSNGPYKIKKALDTRSVLLESNPFYFFKNKRRPEVKVFLNKTTETPDFDWSLERNSNSMAFKNLSSLDYFTLNRHEGAFFNALEKRKTLIAKLNFNDLNALTPSFSQVGCPGLGENLLVLDSHCQFLRADLANDEIKKTPPLKRSDSNQNESSVLLRSFLKNQVKKIFSVNVDEPFSLVKIKLQNPTCLSALEQIFKLEKNNLASSSRLRLENLIRALKTQKMSLSERQGVCGVASDLLFKEEIIGIPTGTEKKTYYLNSNFEGVKINELGELDLTELKEKEKK
jgi:hypothetical protein